MSIELEEMNKSLKQESNFLHNLRKVMRKNETELAKEERKHGLISSMHRNGGERRQKKVAAGFQSSRYGSSMGQYKD